MDGGDAPPSLRVMYPLNAMPARFTAGTTVSYSRTILNLPSSTYGWELYVYVAGDGQMTAGPFAVTNASVDVTLSATATSALTAGPYKWQERLKEKSTGTRVLQLDRGNVMVDLDLSTATAGSGQTHEARVLAALKAKVLGRITADAETIQIDGTTIARIPFELAEKLVWKYQAIVDGQNNPRAVFGTVEANWGTSPFPTFPCDPLPPSGGAQ